MPEIKTYVSVVAEFDEYGNIKPISVKWNDGRTFEIDKVLDCRRAYATKVGGTGMRYTIRVCGHLTYLFEDNGKWFVEANCKS